MPIFSWSGINKSGEEVCGTQFAETPEQLNQILFTQGIAILKSKLLKKKYAINIFNQKINKTDLASFFEYLALLHESGLDLLGCLNTSLLRVKNKTLRKAIAQLITEIDNGATFSDSLSLAPDFFTDPIPQLVMCGERTGKLSYTLEKIADFLRKQCAASQEIWHAAMIPIVTISFAILVSLVIFIFVVPQFESLFSAFNNELPLITRIVFSISSWMQGPIFWGFSLGTLIVIFILNRIIPSFYTMILKIFFMHKMPIVKNLYLLQNQTFIIQNIHLGLSVGLPLKQTLSMAAKSTNNPEFKRSIEHVAHELDSGCPLNQALNATNPKLMPNHTEALIAIGEQTGRLTQIFEKIYLITEHELFNQLKMVTALLQPILLVIVGIIVATLMLAIYFPIFSMAHIF